MKMHSNFPSFRLWELTLLIITGNEKELKNAQKICLSSKWRNVLIVKFMSKPPKHFQSITCLTSGLSLLMESLYLQGFWTLHLLVWEENFELKEGRRTCPISLLNSRSEPAMELNSLIRGQRYVFLLEMVGAGVRSPQQPVSFQQVVVEGCPPLQGQNRCQPCPSIGFSLCLHLSDGLMIVWNRGSSRDFQKGRRNPRREYRVPALSFHVFQAMAGKCKVKWANAFIYRIWEASYFPCSMHSGFVSFPPFKN